MVLDLVAWFVDKSCDGNGENVGFGYAQPTFSYGSIIQGFGYAQPAFSLWFKSTEFKLRQATFSYGLSMQGFDCANPLSAMI